MRVIFGILFAVIFGLIGARLAGPTVDWLIGTQAFTSPDQVAMFDLIARLGVTLLTASIGAAIGIVLARRVQRHLIRPEN